MRRWVIGVCLVLLLGSLSTAARATQGGGRTWTVLAGGGTKDTAVVANAFFPRTVEVAVGDTVRWQFEGFHNVAFTSGQRPPAIEVHEGGRTYFNPEVFFPVGPRTYDGTGYRNSGTPPMGPAARPFTYELTFTKAGTYEYVCILHGPAMSGRVVVRERATGTPEAVLQQARAQQAATIRAGQAAWAKYRPTRAGRTVTVPLVGDVRAGYSILRFTPQPLRVRVGTTVTWTMADNFEIHTVTFLGGQQPPEFVLPQPQAQGPPRLLLNPKVARPTTSKTYGGTGYANSGVLYPPAAPASLPKRFSLTFTRKGRYEYWCIVHVPEGMKGVIVVE